MRVFRQSSSLVLAAMLMVASAGCDGGAEATVTLSVQIDGNGSGVVRSLNLGSEDVRIEIDCKLDDGEVTGQCEDTFVDPDGRGTISLDADPEIATEFSWGAACRDSDDLACDIDFDAREESEIEVHGTFDAKTVSILMTPKIASIASPGDAGAIFVSAQAVDKDGIPLLGLSYDWAISDPEVVSIELQSDSRQVRVVALANGVGVVSATAQGKVGRTSIEVEFTD